MAVSSLTLSHPANTVCSARLQRPTRTVPYSTLLAGSSHYVALSCFLLREASTRRKLEYRRVGCTGSRAQVEVNGSTPASAVKDLAPADGAGKRKKEENQDIQAEEQRLVPVGDGDDPEAVGAISLCLDAIGTMDIDEMDECLAMADRLNERKSKASS